ncbi:MAG: ABC transporter ATP-binding protein [Methylotenera sp.]|nr:ABC transporter ATP-binding protein [Methylotenera sp.]
MSLVLVQDLHKDYETAAGAITVLKQVNFTMDAGDFVAIMGPSGSGKSTFMNILGCLDKPTSGQYTLDGHHVAALDGNELARIRNQTIGFVFQGFNLLSRTTLLDNIALPLVYSGVSKSERQSRAKALLEKVGLGKHIHALSNQISGGQQQRVAIARALVNRPRLILADEPTGNLDSVTSEEIMALFSELNAEGISIILVTHESDIAAHASRQIRFLDGRIVHDERSQSTTSVTQAEKTG